MDNYEMEHSDLVRNLAPGCTVLLKKDGSFPLDGSCKVALYGNGARNTVYGGTGSGEVNMYHAVSIEDGLLTAAFDVTTEKWLNAYDRVREEAMEAFKKQIREEARASKMSIFLYAMGAVMPEPDYDIPLEGEGDVAIYVLSRISGEGSDRQMVPGDVLLTRTELHDILALNELYDKFMLVLNVGGPVDLSLVKDVKNILLLSQLGANTGTILADILLGRAYPSGKLATTWAKADDLPAVGTFGDPDDTLYKEGVYVGYRYYDSVGVEPLYPFGYGLTYTDFSDQVKDVKLDKNQVTVLVEASNTGSFPGREIVEAYVSCPTGDLDQPYQKLAGYAKTAEIAAGESGSVEVTFSMTSLASYDTAKEAYVLEAGDYILRVGSDSRHTVRAAIFHLEESVCVRTSPHVLGDPDFKDFVPENGHFPQDENVPCPEFTLDPADLTEDTPKAAEFADDIEEKMYRKLDRFPEDAILRLNMGLYKEKTGMASVVGNAAQTVPGAAGETTNLYASKGLPGLIMADGPAGLRLAKDYYVTKDGEKKAAGSALPGFMTWLLPDFVKKAMEHLPGAKPPKDAQIRHQYCTAIPIGTAIAQSFDVSLAEKLGDMVGEEMERFGVQLWLAPGLNIHRSILCGRNFEYYSEDPLIAGTMAAAITRGVEGHPGCGTTIKHFAANNQEYRRYTSNSCVSERAMREIYLKGFEICVKETQPHAVMTSYNLLNGTHTSERKELIDGILRGEFGFKGLVMSDWVTPGMLASDARYGMPDPALVAAAGNDLFMPGSAADMKKLKAGLDEGRVTLEQLKRNAARVLARMVKDAKV